MLSKKLYAEKEPERIVKLSLARADIFVDVKKEIPISEKNLQPTNYHRTTSSQQPLSQKYLRQNGSINKNKVAELLKRVKEEFETDRPFSSHFNELNYTCPDQYPSAKTLLNWHGFSSWHDLLRAYNYLPSGNYRYYPEKFFEECLRLAALIIDDKPHFSKFDYDALDLQDVNILDENLILTVMNKNNLEFLRWRGSFPTAATVAAHFKGWNNAKLAAGVAIARHDVRWAATAESLLSALFLMAKEFNALPSVKDIENSDKVPTLNTFGDVFKTKSWSVILFYLVKELKKNGHADLIDLSRLGKVTKESLLKLLSEVGYEQLVC